MSVSRLVVHNLRNLTNVDIRPSPAVNLVYGKNGSGKTSLLESVNLLTLGRSFRSHKIKPLIQEDRPELTVFGRVGEGDAGVPLGVSRARNGESVFKAQGRPVESLAELASYLPLQVINADAFSLLEGSPKVRRQFLDWLVFHVEPDFYPAWKAAQRCLKHRNTILRRGRISTPEMAPWNQELIAQTERIQALRVACFERLKESFSALFGELDLAQGLNLSLYRGWDKELNFAQALQSGAERDIRQGFTGVGFHRADIRIKVNGQNAADILSRGQQKLLVCALKVAQGKVYERITNRKCVYLVDDLPAELDKIHRLQLVSWLEALGTQVFITGVERSALLEPWAGNTRREIKVFHVERGEITSEDYPSGE